METKLKSNALDAFMQEHSSEAASYIISALTNGRPYTGIINLPNKGQIASLPSDVVVETFGVVNHTGASGFALGDLPPGIQSVVSRHVSNQEMIVEAALEGDKLLALQALINDPMVFFLKSDISMFLTILNCRIHRLRNQP